MEIRNVSGAAVASVLTLATVLSPVMQAETRVQAATKVKLNKSEIELVVGKTAKLKLKGAKAVKFLSSNKKIAKVSKKGKITAKKAGTCTISVYDENGKVYKCDVTVTKKGSKNETKDYGNIDLGGMEIVIRDWWSPMEPDEPRNAYEEALMKNQQDVMEKYNFVVKRRAISDWGSVPEDFVLYTACGGDSINYVFVLRSDPVVANAMYSGLMYDLSKLDCLDFSEEKFKANKTHELYSIGSSIYACSMGPSEPRNGMYFNPQVLKDAGIDPESIYDMQANGTWTWDAFEEIMSKVQRDTDGDGADDVFGLCCNNSEFTNAAVFSNGGAYIGKDSKGKFTYRLEDPETVEALEWMVQIFDKYNNHNPEDASWDYYLQEFKSGTVAFMSEEEWRADYYGGFDECPFTPGFVMFPKGPKASTYVNVWNNNPYAIPACYDPDRAWKIAFALNAYYNPIPGYEDYNEYIQAAENFFIDERAQKETIPMMCEAEHGVVAYHNVIPKIDLGANLTWSISSPGADVAEAIEYIRNDWKAYIDEANK